MSEYVKNSVLIWGIVIGFAMMLVDAFSLNFDLDAEPLAAKMKGGAVTQAQLGQALAKVGAANGESRQRVLNFLVDEELLVLRAKSVGLLESDRTIRKALSRAAIDQEVKVSLAKIPSDKELRSFYHDHQILFTAEPKIHLKQIFFNKRKDKTHTSKGQSPGDLGLNAKDRAEATHRALLVKQDAGQLSDPLIFPLPETLLPVSILHRTLGPTMASQVKKLRPGQVSEVIESSGGYHLFVGQDFVAAQLRAYDDIKDDVLSEYRRRARDYALEKKLRELWAQANIRITAKLKFDLAQLSQ